MFIEKPANHNSLRQRKLIHGVGINDAPYIIRPLINGKKVMCRYYSVWHSMISRCYCKKTQQKSPTYINCSVCDEWLLFSSFKSWMKNQNFKGMCLDKDILINSNKTYSPEFCIFVTQEINNLLLDNPSIRGDHYTGVSFDKARGKYSSSCKRNGKRVGLGRFNSPEEAFKAYKKFKYEVIKEVALKQLEPLRSALLAYKINPY